MLAPERRLPRLLHEAAQQLKGRDIEITERGPVTWQATGSALTLLGISWLEMLEAMENVTSDIVANDEHVIVLCTGRAERAGRQLEDRTVLVSHIREGKQPRHGFFLATSMPSMSSCRNTIPPPS